MKMAAHFSIKELVTHFQHIEHLRDGYKKNNDNEGFQALYQPKVRIIIPFISFKFMFKKLFFTLKYVILDTKHIHGYTIKGRRGKYPFPLHNCRFAQQFDLAKILQVYVDATKFACSLHDMIVPFGC